MRDIGIGCEGIEAAFENWIHALEVREFDRLNEILSDDFALTCDPQIAGGRMTKTEFIEFDRHMLECSVEILSLTARRHMDTAITQLFAKVQERFEGEPAPGVDTEIINRMVGGRTLAYASAWRPSAKGGWKCFHHHLFGPID